MKKALLAFILILTIMSSSKAQNIVIPDSLFRNALLTNPSVNTNGDTSITVLEAAGFYDTLSLWHLHIHTLDGIQYFINMTGLDCEGECCGVIGLLRDLDVTQCVKLKWLNCFNNLIHNLDLSQNTDLQVLNCGSNPLGTLDFSTNTLLRELYCNSDSLTSINVSNNTNLEQFYCMDNFLTNINVTNNASLKALYFSNNPVGSFDVSHNLNLEELLCVGNQLTNLDVSQNLLLSYFYCYNNPLLASICVNSVSYAISQEAITTYVKDSTATWSQACNTGILESQINLYTIYPNPSFGLFNFNDLKGENIIEVYDLTGRLIYRTVTTTSFTKVDLSEKAKGRI